MSIVVTRDSFK